MTGFSAVSLRCLRGRHERTSKFAGSSSEAPAAPSTMAQTPWLAVAGNELVCRAQRVQGSITRRKPSKRSPLGSTSLRCRELPSPWLSVGNGKSGSSSRIWLNQAVCRLFLPIVDPQIHNGAQTRQPSSEPTIRHRGAAPSTGNGRVPPLRQYLQASVFFAITQGFCG